jgi:hypothetical protein
MQNPRVLTSILAAALLGAPAAAAAQSLPSPSALTLKAGLSVQYNAASPAAAGGIDYIFHPASLVEPFDGSFYADIFGKSGGAGIAIRNGGPAYIGAGVGLYSVSLAPTPACPAAIGPLGCARPTYSATGAGGKIFGGFVIAPHATLELGYHVLPKAGGLQADTVTAQLGFRF